MPIRSYCTELLPGVLRVRVAPLVWAHVLLGEGRAVLVDSGLFPITRRLDAVLRAYDLELAQLDAILLTHGHLDHNANTSRLAALTGARVFAPEADRLHVAFRYPYQGISRVCGGLETLGCAVLRVEAPQVDHWFGDGEELGVWEDLRAVSLPGHSAGHCGFFSARRKLLISGDLFAWWFRPRPPPPWFNLDIREIRRSIVKAAALEPQFVAGNHGFVIDPMRQAEGLRQLAARVARDI